MILWSLDVPEKGDARGMRQECVGEHPLRGKGEGETVRDSWRGDGKGG